jgi:hypothetical protein
LLEYKNKTNGRKTEENLEVPNLNLKTEEAERPKPYAIDD